MAEADDHGQRAARVARHVERAAKGFFIGNALVWLGVNPTISLAYLCALGAHTLVKRATRNGETLQRPFTKFIAGRNGTMMVNATLTEGTALTVLASGESPLLAIAGGAFGAANGTQAMTYAGVGAFGRLSEKKKGWVLAVAELTMVGGFVALGVHVGMATLGVAGIAAVGVALVGARQYFGKAIPAELVYIDMLCTAMGTGIIALQAGHSEIALSRLMVVGSLISLALARAADAGRPSLFVSGAKVIQRMLQRKGAETAVIAFATPDRVERQIPSAAPKVSGARGRANIPRPCSLSAYHARLRTIPGNGVAQRLIARAQRMRAEHPKSAGANETGIKPLLRVQRPVSRIKPRNSPAQAQKAGDSRPMP